ncbi:class I SAM-dependent methyltransferase [bacterium]|nr:class I SAM-dependent methyltransferase [bacterium]
MSITTPSKTSVLLHEFFWLTLMRGYYRRYVQSFHLKGDEKVLDFGCGPGSTAKFIAGILEKSGGELTCIDLSETWIERSKKHLSSFSNVDYYAGDIRHWDKKDSYFDAVTIHFILHDIDRSERVDVLKTLAEKMKIGARLFIREPTKKDHGMRPEEIRDLMAKSGLEETRSQETKGLVRGPAYTGVFRKTS